MMFLLQDGSVKIKLAFNELHYKWIDLSNALISASYIQGIFVSVAVLVLLVLTLTWLLRFHFRFGEVRYESCHGMLLLIC